MNKRNTQKVLRVVESALQTLKNKKNWIQFAAAQTAEGSYSNPGNAQACKFCASGALIHYARIQSHPSDPRPVVSFLERSAQAEVVRALEQVSHRQVPGLIYVNDGSRTAHSRIVRGLRVARNNLRKQLASAE